MDTSIYKNMANIQIIWLVCHLPCKKNKKVYTFVA